MAKSSLWSHLWIFHKLAPLSSVCVNGPIDLNGAKPLSMHNLTQNMIT